MFTESHIRLRRRSGQGPAWNQAEKIISRFGVVPDLANALGVHHSTVYRWLYAAPDGTDGLVPISSIPLVVDAAKRLRVRLRASDWMPERIEYA